MKMYAQDNPNTFRVTDPTLEKGEGTTQVYADWADHLSGKLRVEFARSPKAFFKKHFKREL